MSQEHKARRLRKGPRQDIGPVFARGIQMAIAGFTEVLLHSDAGTPMVDYDQVWLVKLIVEFDGVTHIRNLAFQANDRGQIESISTSRISSCRTKCLWANTSSICARLPVPS